jgi:hypothetical protein
VGRDGGEDGRAAAGAGVRVDVAQQLAAMPSLAACGSGTDSKKAAMSFAIVTSLAASMAQAFSSAAPGRRCSWWALKSS